MSTRNIELPAQGVFGFRGGLASVKPNTLLSVDEALDLDNVFITPGGGLEKRRGNTEFNSTAMSSGDAVTGLHYFNPAPGTTDYLVSVAGSTIFKSDNLDGTMDDITGGLTVTSGANNIWTSSSMNDLAIFVGGPDVTPDAPFTYSGTGNAALLGGTPPAGRFGFQMNNRFFIGSTVTDPSTIFWSGLADPADWTGVTSGRRDVFTGDGDTVVTWAKLNNDIVLVFKQNSIHQFVVREPPFPSFLLFENTGAIGKHGAVPIDGLVYYITPRGKMEITNGVSVFTEKEFPRLHNIDDKWENLNQSRLQFVVGFRNKGKEFDHLVWMVSDGASTENDLAIVWDLRNKCWLKHSAGYKGNVATVTQGRTVYTGHYDGKIYQQDVLDTYTDASESSGAIDGMWRTGWNTPVNLQESIKPFRFNMPLLSQSAGTLTVGYGFDFNEDSRTEALDMSAGASIWGAFIWGVGAWSGQADTIRSFFMRGRGNALQFSFRNNAADQTFTIHGYSISGVPAGQKLFQVV